MDKKLIAQTLLKYLSGILLMGVLIFLPAGTVSFWNGWVLMGLLFIPMFLVGLIMALKKPELLRKRLSSKEKLKNQQMVVKMSGLMFIAGFVLAGLDYRFNWSHLPGWAITCSSIIFILSYAMYVEVIRENEYLSRTIEVQENQKVIDTGLYGIVRHPMYSATILLFMSMPIVLGSFYSFLAFCIYPFIIAKRIKCEETFLETELEGYTTYKRKVKYRMLPFIW